jgi:hypothetical protein
MLFDAPHEELSDEEIAAVLRQTIASPAFALSTWLMGYAQQACR